MRTRDWVPAVLAAFALLAPTTAGAWVVTPELGFGHGIVLTSTGDLVTAGETFTPAGSDFSVRRQSAVDGSDVWHYQIDGSGVDGGGFNDYAAAVALDGAGNLLAFGATRNAGTKLDGQIVKLTQAGAPIWTRQLDSASHGDDFVSDMALAPGGDVAVTGVFGVADVFSSYYFTVARLAGATGVPLWQHDVPGMPHSRGIAVDFDAAGNVLAFGDLDLAPGSDAVAVKLDGATGDELWRTILNGGTASPDIDTATTAAVDAAGDYYVAGRASTTGGDGFTVYKLSGATGGVLWRYDHTPPARDAGYVQLLELDGTGHLYAAADLDGRYTLQKLTTATGTLVWSRRFPQGYYTSLAFDPAGDLVMGGGQGVLFSLQKVRASDGHKRWRRKLRGNPYNGGYAAGVAVDATGAVFAVGGHVAPPLPKGKVNGLPSYTVVRACGANGRIRRTDACP